MGDSPPCAGEGSNGPFRRTNGVLGAPLVPLCATRLSTTFFAATSAATTFFSAFLHLHLYLSILIPCGVYRNLVLPLGDIKNLVGTILGGFSLVFAGGTRYGYLQ